MTSFQKSNKTIAFLNKYNLFESDHVQHIQLQHRLDLVEAFDIQKGMRVLEIGCGQGDTTVALANAVGETGYVDAIDIASPQYGAPLTLRQAADRIKRSMLGDRISFHFEMDLDKFPITTPYDVAVLSHCSWYFKRPEDLLHIFKRLRGISKRICFAEWDLDFRRLTQRTHFYAATILALYSNFVNNEGNIQNLFDEAQIHQLLQQAGFSINKRVSVDASFLQDARWEKNYANSIQSEFSNAPLLIQTLITSYYHLMNNSKEAEEHSLNSFVLCTDKDN